MKWDSDTKTAECETCTHAGAPPGETDRAAAASVAEPEPGRAAAIDPGVAGASARREYERRSQQERRRRQAVVARDAAWRKQLISDHPILGRVASALIREPVVAPESQRTRAWRQGAAGEELLGRMLEAVDGIVVLHDRRIPGSRANIDHIALSAAGVFVVDPKNYDGMVEKRDLGGWFRTDERLYVDGRDRTNKLVEGILWQVETVRKVLDGEFPGIGIPVRGVLCFVGPNWRRFLPRTLTVRGVQVMWPAQVVELLRQQGPLSPERVQEMGLRLSGALPPA